MNSSLRCLCSYTGGLAIAVGACSSNSPGSGGSSGSSSGTGSGSGSGGAPVDASVVDGPGTPCPPMTHVTAVQKLTLDSSWGQTLGVAASSGPPGSNNVLIWLLSNYDIGADGKITGKVQTCQNQTAPLTLTAVGIAAVGAPAGMMAQVAISIPPSTWNASSMPKSAITGQLGGWNIGSSLSIDPVVTLAGLNPASMYAKPDATWPMSVTQLMFTAACAPSSCPPPGGTWPAGCDVVDDDCDGKAGITAIPRSATTTGAADSSFYVPHTATSGGVPTDKLYLALRTEISLYGTSSSCTEGSGTATVALLDNHVVGCHIPDPAAPNNGECDASQYGYIDSNSISYMVMSGTYATKQLPSVNATCADAIAALK
jgi:hypothetical protein